MAIPINIVYIYYWLSVAWATGHKHISREIITDHMLDEAMRIAQESGTPNKFIVSITTKGRAIDVVMRGIDNVLAAAILHPILARCVTVEIVTEIADEVALLTQHYNYSVIPITSYQIPANYVTPKRTLFKARAMEFMVELHRNHPTPNSYMVHYDEESVFTPDNFARLVHHLLCHPVDISEGVISYGLNWRRAPLLCRAMESNRPFGCHECYTVMTAMRPPHHLHGSNLVVRQQLENEIGWDIGKLNDNGFLAEDLVFGLRAYLKYGKQVFGWHRAEMNEQPPFTIKAASARRERWVLGALQAVTAVQTMPGWLELGIVDRIRIRALILMGVISFVLGFPVSLLFIGMTAYILGLVATGLLTGNSLQIPFFMPLFTIPGIAMWLGATQLGLAYNLRYTQFSPADKLLEHMKILLITPFAGVVETWGAVRAVIRWVCGDRRVTWIPTPKT